MNEEETQRRWLELCDRVTDLMKIHTRPFVAAMAGREIGTGTFVGVDPIGVVTCAHVAKAEPYAHYLDDGGSTEIRQGLWCTEPDEAVDAAFAFVPAEEWKKVADRARPLPGARFSDSHAPVPRELLFFRGVAGENVGYLGSFGAQLIFSGYCSQEKEGSGDDRVFEMLWKPGDTAVTSGTDAGVRERVAYEDPRGFSGSLVWNTRFVQGGCNLSSWRPDDAVVTGLLRRYDAATGTLLAWRVEHLSAWLRTSTDAFG